MTENHRSAPRVLCRLALRSGAAVAVLGGLLLATAPASGALAVTHAPAITVHPIRLNTVNWSGMAGFGSRAPGWYADSSGIVHLQGAAKRISTVGTKINVLGILPKAARPSRSVFVIVHTFTGTYADVGIAPDGRISLTNARPPAVTDYTLVSLEGITYKRSGSVRLIAVNRANWSGKAGFGSSAPGWYADSSGIVHLQGAAKQVASSGLKADVIGTLPTAARPSRKVFVIVHTAAGTYADAGIAPDGRISLINARPPAVTDYTFVSLEGITFKRSGSVQMIAVNRANWSGKAGYGSTRPGWYADSSGIVHLQGAAKQVASSGPNAYVIGTLPKAARPSRDVFVIVHTFAGTYADVGIAPDGTINLINSRPPAVTDFTFVSLEGITFKR